MRPEEVLLALVDAGAVLWVDEGRLRYKALVATVLPGSDLPATRSGEGREGQQ